MRIPEGVRCCEQRATALIVYVHLKGSCDAHPANAEKCHGLYRKLLNDLGVWRDPEYLRRKERRTVRDDRRDVLPACVLKVQYNNLISAT